MFSLGGRLRLAPPPRKRPYRIGIGLKCTYIAQFAKACSLKKIRPIILIVWVLGRIEKKRQKKGQKNEKQVCFKQILKCDTCFYIHFSRAF